MREGSFEIVARNSARDDPSEKKRPISWNEVIATVVYEKKGDRDAGNCILQPKYPQGSTFQDDKLVVDATALTTPKVYSKTYSSEFYIRTSDL